MEWKSTEHLEIRSYYEAEVKTVWVRRMLSENSVHSCQLSYENCHIVFRILFANSETDVYFSNFFNIICLNAITTTLSSFIKIIVILVLKQWTIQFNL